MTSITITGNCTRTPELKVAATGTPWTSFGLAYTPRVRKGDEWVDSETEWYNVSCWGDQAENVCNTVDKGTRLLVTGELKPREYTDRDGKQRVSLDLAASEIAVTLRWATARVKSTERADAEAVAAGTGEDPWQGPAL